MPGRIYTPEDLLMLGRLLDEAVAALPDCMRTPANRTALATLILERTSAADDLRSFVRLMQLVAPST